jgi:hypothetical protein
MYHVARGGSPESPSASPERSAADADALGRLLEQVDHRTPEDVSLLTVRHAPC